MNSNNGGDNSGGVVTIVNDNQKKKIGDDGYDEDDSGASETIGSDFAILADTEESDGTDRPDPELGLADYWKCVKCKNQQNNPMYRYCEKCYQVSVV